MTLEEMLAEKFGYQDFKLGQKATIESVLNTGATLSILPTGTGKSLCYQLPSYYLPGVTLIVSPLVSLMEDQVQQMRQYGEKAAVALNSQLNYHEKEWVLTHIQDYKFIFISPEMLFQDTVRQRLTRLAVSLFVVDEAHCISQWGLDFRPEYERLYQIIAELPHSRVMALTATATDKVAEDIINKLFIHQTPEVIRHSVDRENIGFQVVETQDKFAFIQDYFQTKKGFAIIYFSSKKQTELISARINETLPLRSAFYHGDLTSQERSLIQQQALSGQLDILCATSAFGMGINKPDVRHVIHYHLPASIEAYLQEAGRAGRDGKPSMATLLYQEGDENIHYFLQTELQTAQVSLSQLETKTEAELKALLPLLDELTLKWVEGFLTGHSTFNELAEALQLKQDEKMLQLSAMQRYLKIETCRRAFLLAYFSESTGRSQENCCDNCANFSPNAGESVTLTPERLEYAKNWQENLKNLFISNN